MAETYKSRRGGKPFGGYDGLYAFVRANTQDALTVDREADRLFRVAAGLGYEGTSNGVRSALVKVRKVGGVPFNVPADVAVKFDEYMDALEARAGFRPSKAQALSRLLELAKGDTDGR